jgi:hypothetical protein
MSSNRFRNDLVKRSVDETGSEMEYKDSEDGTIVVL